MRITRTETFLVPPRRLFCRTETDDAGVGWGEPVRRHAHGSFAEW